MIKRQTIFNFIYYIINFIRYMYEAKHPELKQQKDLTQENYK